MHLDGLGLGTGLSREEASDIKRVAIQYLTTMLIGDGSNISADLEINSLQGLCDMCQGRYGIPPFFITGGPYPVPSSLNFNLNAPTTRANIFRVLRAMQLSKPILLEGSPGTGKTR